MLSPCQVGDFSSAAAWRTNRLGHFQLMERMLASGRPVSPVFTSPWLGHLASRSIGRVALTLELPRTYVENYCS